MSITSTVSTLQIYVSKLKLSSALPVPLIFIPCIDKKKTFAENSFTEKQSKLAKW